jgi:5-formyltetrahydrofolate cyclo-ligase
LISTTPTAPGKGALRADLRARRVALPALERMHAAEAIVGHLLQQSLFAQPGYVAGYWAMAGELPLHVLQMRLRPDQVWCLPCIQPDQSLRFAPWRPGDPLVSNRYGIPEPQLAAESQLAAEDMAVILLPVLGFDRSGGRLGMGGGYYDRSLGFRQRQPAPPALIGIAYSWQETALPPSDPWDVRLDAVACEREFIVCAPAQASAPKDPSE